MGKDKIFFGPRIVDIVNDNLGFGSKIAEAQPKQIDLVEAAIEQLKELSKEK